VNVPRWYAAAGPAYLAVLLAVDTQVGLGVQLVLGVVTWLVLLAAIWRLAAIMRAQVLGVVVFATIAEVTGSLIWGVYRYRLHNLPLFIPPAHGLVYLSGVGASKESDKHWFRYKWEAEKYLQDSGIEWVIIRPTWVYGPGDVSLNRFLGFGKLLPFIPMFGNGKQDMQPVFIDDVGRVTADAALRPEAANKLFELGGPEVLSMNDVVKTALDVQGKRRRLLHQPAMAGKTIGAITSILPRRPLTPDAIDFITEPAVADNTLLNEVLHPHLTPLREALATYLAGAQLPDTAG